MTVESDDLTGTLRTSQAYHEAAQYYARKVTRPDLTDPMAAINAVVAHEALMFMAALAAAKGK